MEQLDDFLKKKFQEDNPADRFAFSEEYWEGARKVLEDAERKKKRRALIWLWSCAFLLAFLGIAAWWGFSRHQKTQPLVAWQTPAGAPAQPLLAPATNNATTAKEEKEQGASQLASETPGTPNPANSASDNQDRLQYAGAARPANQHQKNNLPGVKPSAPSLDLPSSTPTVATEATDKPHTEMPLSAENSTENKVTAVTNPSALPTLAALEQLPLPYPMPQPGLTPAPEVQAAVAETPVKVHRERRSRLLLEAGASMVSAGDRTRLLPGGIFGMTLDRQISPKWALQAGLRYRLAPARQENQPKSTQLRYSFGYNLTEYSEQSQYLHLAEVPLGARWQAAHWQWEGGVTVAYLWRASGKITQFRQSSLQGPMTENYYRHVQTDRQPFRKFNTSLYAGVTRPIGPRVQSFARAQYRLGNLQTLDAEVPVFENKWWFDAGIRIRF